MKKPIYYFFPDLEKKEKPLIKLDTKAFTIHDFSKKGLKFSYSFKYRNFSKVNAKNFSNTTHLILAHKGWDSLIENSSKSDINKQMIFPPDFTFFAEGDSLNIEGFVDIKKMFFVLEHKYTDEQGIDTLHHLECIAFRGIEKNVLKVRFAKDEEIFQLSKNYNAPFQ